MRKYLLRYLIFWLPAVLVAYFYSDRTTLSQVLQWFFAFFMVFGWTVNTAMAAYHFPRTVLSWILIYSGVNVLIYTADYSMYPSGALYHFVHNYSVMLSYKPLDIFIVAILDFNIPHQLYVLGFLMACCLLGYLAGLLWRRLHPNPYRPKITG